MPSDLQPCSIGETPSYRGPRGYHLGTVPLSEHEQKILDEIERNLADEDPRFGRERGPTRASDAVSRARIGILTFILGFGLLILFFVTRVLFVGLLAFVGMVAGIVLLASPVSALMSSAKDNTAQKGESVKRSFDRFDDNVRRRFRRR